MLTSDNKDHDTVVFQAVWSISIDIFINFVEFSQ